MSAFWNSFLPLASQTAPHSNHTNRLYTSGPAEVQRSLFSNSLHLIGLNVQSAAPELSLSRKWILNLQVRGAQLARSVSMGLLCRRRGIRQVRTGITGGAWLEKRSRVLSFCGLPDVFLVAIEQRRTAARCACCRRQKF
jgi:hypothetical protein